MSEEKTAFEYVIDRYPSHIEMDKKEEEHLQDEVRSLLKEDVKALVAVRNLLKSDATFSNSTGELYGYLKDRKVCLSCKGKYSLCPKKNKGYYLDIYYDPDRDEIRTKSMDCSYLKELEKVYADIVYSNVSRESMFHQLDSFLSYIRRKDSTTMADSTRLLLQTSKDIKAFGDEAPMKGMILKSINQEDLDIDLMKAMCFMYAKSAIRTCFVDVSLLIRKISDKSYQAKEDLMIAYERMSDIPALFLTGFEKIGYLSDEWKKKIYHDLMKKRAMKGKITILSTKSMQSLPSYLTYRLRGLDFLGDTIEIWNSLFKIVKISDFDMR